MHARSWLADRSQPTGRYSFDLDETAHADVSGGHDVIVSGGLGLVSESPDLHWADGKGGEVHPGQIYLQDSVVPVHRPFLLEFGWTVSCEKWCSNRSNVGHRIVVWKSVAHRCNVEWLE